MNKFEKQIEVRWADCDLNRHVRHSAYYDFGTHVRIRFFEENGYGEAILNQLQIGPILFKEECSFIREIKLDETLRVNLLRGKMRADASRWILHHEIYNENTGDKKAHITLHGAWMDLNLRKLTIPPENLAKALHQLPEGDFYSYKK